MLKLIRPSASPAPTTEAPRAGNTGVSRIIGVPTVNPKTLAGIENTRDFVAPDIDFDEINLAIDADSYVAQAIERYRELMFKAGWDLVGSNPRAVRYVRDRLNIMAEATELPTEMLWMEMADDLVTYANSVVIKTRDPDFPWPRGMRVIPISNRGPVVGYFPVNIAQMSVRRSKNGVIRRWRQEVGNEYREFNPEDVVHIFYRRRKGEPFGRPFLTAAISDVRALRQAEEQVLRLIYRNLFPFIHAQVGNDEVPGTDAEITQVQQVIDSMELEGGLATSERVKLNPVAVDQIIDAYNYLLYFEKRVFTALGVSDVLMGRAATASRASAENLSVEMRDRIKALQRILSLGIDNFIIHELLLEGGFDPITNPRDDVDFVFNEIDLDAKIKSENQAVFLYQHNAITEDEMRARIGKDPITDRSKLYLNLVTIPRALATRGQVPEQDTSTSSRSEDASESEDLTGLNKLRHDIGTVLASARSPQDFIPTLRRLVQEAELSDRERHFLELYMPQLEDAARTTTVAPILFTTIESILDLVEMASRG